MTEGVGVLGYGTAINFLQVKFCYLESKNNNFECFYEAQDNKKKKSMWMYLLVSTITGSISLLLSFQMEIFHSEGATHALQIKCTVKNKAIV